MSRVGNAETRRAARRSLDRRFASLRQLAADVAVPRGGWVLAVREALGMSARDLAARMGTAETAVLSLERNERAGRVRLDTLRRAAEALDCELIYVLVPRSSLDAMVDERARSVAASQLRRVDHSMRLEAQGVDAEVTLGQLNDHAVSLRDRAGLWRDA